MIMHNANEKIIFLELINKISEVLNISCDTDN